jgi:hypothetical protein
MTGRHSVTTIRHNDTDTIEIVQADPLIYVTQDLLDNADPRYLQHGEGLLRMTDSYGRTLTYRLTGQPGPYPESLEAD